MRANEFKIGQRVEHINHGLGTIVAHDDFSDDSIYVEFDVKPDEWDKTLCISINCLKAV